MEHLAAEIIVIGNGAAGLRAAIAAREAGRDVLVLAKAPQGKGTSTLLSGGGFSTSGQGFSRADHRAATLAAGRGLNQLELVEILIDETPARLEELIAWGLKASVEPGHLLAQGRPPAWGEEILRCLLARAEELGVRFLSGLMVWRLVLDQGRAGLLVYSWVRRNWLVLTARAVVLATGGASALYRRHDNPQRMLGEGYGLALEAGARLKGMEFAQFYPLTLAEPGRPTLLVPPSLELSGRIINSQGQDIHDKYGLTERPASLKARDRLSQALFREAEEGRETFLDLRGATKEAWCSNYLAASMWEVLTQKLDALERPLRVQPAAHFSMGGLDVDAWGQSSVPGLFACGESAGGLHGANRLGGNALSETIVFGARTGQAASAWAESNPGPPSPAWTGELAGQVPEPTAGGSPRGAAELRHRLREMMWRDGGIRRDRAGLERALAELAGFKEEAAGLGLDLPERVRDVLELRLALITAGLILQAALRREESRGAHFRKDFPEQDDARWRGHWLVGLDGHGREEWSFEPLPPAPA